jgi:hypothetical protein
MLRLTGTCDNLLIFVIFAVLIFYGLTVAGTFILLRRRPNAERPYGAFGYPVVPALYILAAAAIAADLLILKPAHTLPGLGIILLGAPVYFWWRRMKGRSQSASAHVEHRRGRTGGTATDDQSRRGFLRAFGLVPVARVRRRGAGCSRTAEGAARLTSG